MNEGFFEIAVYCHSHPKDFATAKILAIPELDYLRYALPDKANDLYSAKEFKTLLMKTNFERSPEIVILVINNKSGKKTALKCRLRWPDKLKPGTRENRFGFEVNIPE